jgi:hypothetical protein
VLTFDLSLLRADQARSAAQPADAQPTIVRTTSAEAAS